MNNIMQNFLLLQNYHYDQTQSISLAAHQHLPISVTSPPPDMIVEGKKDKTERNN